MKKTFLTIVLTSMTLSYAGDYLAFIYNNKTNSYEIGELSPDDASEGGGEGTGDGDGDGNGENPIDPNKIDSIKCTWGECIGSYASGQAFYIDGMNNPSEQIIEDGVTNAGRSFAKTNYLFIENNGDIYGRGANSRGSIGVNSSDSEVTKLTKVSGLTGSVIDVIPNRGTIIHTTTGLFLAGYNHLVDNIPISVSDPIYSENITFKQFISSPTITDIDMRNDALMYADNGKLFVLGLNRGGRFGMDDSQVDKEFTTYTEVNDLDNVKEVFIPEPSERSYTAILKEGTVWVSGEMAPGIPMMEPTSTFKNTGFAVSELNMFDYNWTTYIIKNNKLYFSGANPVNMRNFEDSFTLLSELSSYNIKSFVKEEDALLLLTTDGKFLSLIWDGETNESHFEEVEHPEFLG